MKILKNESKKVVSESFRNIPVGTQFVVGSQLTMDMDIYTHDDSGNVMMAVESMIERLMKSGRYDPETDAIAIGIDICDKEEIDDEGNIIR